MLSVSGVLENLIQIVRFDNLCYMLVDDENYLAMIGAAV